MLLICCSYHMRFFIHPRNTKSTRKIKHTPPLFQCYPLKTLIQTLTQVYQKLISGKRRFVERGDVIFLDQVVVNGVCEVDSLVLTDSMLAWKRKILASIDIMSEAEPDDESEEKAAEGEYYNAKGSKKKGKKRQELEAQHQAEEAARESRNTKQDRYAEMWRRKDEEHEARERMLDEEAMARKAKEEKAAALEFEKWKGDFSIDAEGTTENEVQDGSQGLPFDFVEYIKLCYCPSTKFD